MAKSLQQKQEEAKDRILAYNKLPPADKLKLIRSRRGKSKKEESKILKTIKGDVNEEENKNSNEN